MNKFEPKLFKTYKILTNSGWVYRFYYKYDSVSDVYYYLSIETQDLYIDEGHEFKKFLWLDHYSGDIKSKHAHELIYYMFTYFGG